MVAALQAHAANLQDPSQSNPKGAVAPIGKPALPTAAAHTSSLPSSTVAAASSSSPAPLLPSPNGTEDSRRGQNPERAAWRQRKSQEAIAEYERAYRVVQAVEGPKLILDQGAQPPQQPGPKPPLPQNELRDMPNKDEGRGETAADSNGSKEGDARGATSELQTSTSSGTDNSTPKSEPSMEAAAAAASAAAAAASEAAATAIANAPSAGGDAGGNATGGRCTEATSDLESDITGTVSDAERERMEVDAVVDKIPAEQRAGVKALLEKRKARRIRQLQRHKKPEGDELGGGAVGDAKRR